MKSKGFTVNHRGGIKTKIAYTICGSPVYNSNIVAMHFDCITAFKALYL